MTRNLVMTLASEVLEGNMWFDGSAFRAQLDSPAILPYHLLLSTCLLLIDFLLAKIDTTKAATMQTTASELHTI